MAGEPDGTLFDWRDIATAHRWDTLGDVRARPLLVTEGSAVDKLAAIEDNVYLSHALGRLRQRDLPLVVFGSSLGSYAATRFLDREPLLASTTLPVRFRTRISPPPSWRINSRAALTASAFVAPCAVARR